MSTTTEGAPVSSDALLKTILKENKAAIELIPDDISDKDLRMYSKAVSLAYCKAKDAVERTRPLICRILLLYKRRPALFTDLGFRSYDQWMSSADGVLKHFGVSRPEAYDLVRIAEEMGFVPTETLQQIGINKLKTASKIIRQRTAGITDVEMKHRVANEWVAAATEEGMSVTKLIAKAEEEKIVDKGSLKPKVPITISANPAIKEQWDKMRTDEELKAYLYGVSGQTITDDLLLALCMDEAGSEWAAQMANEQRQEGVPQAV